MQEIASKNAPHISVVIPHYAFAGLAFFAITLLLCFFPEALTQHHFNPKLLSITHLTVLGWISMVIFGALYQIIPVILEVKLYSEKLAKASFVLLAAGAILLSFSFWKWPPGFLMIIAGSVLVLAIVLFAINTGISGIRSGNKSIEKLFILTAIAWLVFTVLIGLILAINLLFPFIPKSHLELLKLHAHSGAIGWFLLLIIGVSSRLLPMFLVSHQLNKRKLEIAYVLINSGLITLMAGFYFENTILIQVPGLLIVSGVVSFILFLAETYRKRIKANLDIGMQQTALSFLILFIPLILFLIFSVQNLTGDSLFTTWPVVYGSAIFIGFITSLILGQTYKTLPFIVWLNHYRGRIGKGKVPMPKDLYSHLVAKAQMWVYMAGFLTLMFGVLLANEFVIHIAGVLLVITALLYNFNLFKIIFHKSPSDA